MGDLGVVGRGKADFHDVLPQNVWRRGRLVGKKKKINKMALTLEKLEIYMELKFNGRIKTTQAHWYQHSHAHTYTQTDKHIRGRKRMFFFS